MVTWKVCPDFPRYRVSDRGGVIGPRGTEMKWQYNKKTGYYWVKIQTGPGKAKTVTVHRLVLLTFRGPCPPGMESLHKDEDKSNNFIDNLAWGTHKVNIKSMWDQGARSQRRGWHRASQ